MMQHAHAPVHATAAPPCPPRGENRISLNSRFLLVCEHADQEVGTTASRRARRGDFLRAATWAITHRLHPKASDTTLRVARDLAARLNADGHVAYCRDTMWRRLGISRRTLERHIAILRELGLLVWAVHGTRTNTRPAGSGEWAGTATIYAAVVPPAWDDARGHRVSGRGYHARHIGFTEHGRQLAIADARRRARPKRRRDTPSCKTNHLRPTAEMRGKKNNTSAPRGARPRSRRRHEIPEPYRASPGQAAHAVSVAAWVRPRVPWTQGEGLRRLAFALRPWIATGLSAADIAADLSVWRVPRRPASPAGLIMARWSETESQNERAAGPGNREDRASTVPPNAAFLKAVDAVRARLTSVSPPVEPEPDPPGFVIRDRILASLAQADRAHRARTAEQCLTYAEWEAVCDARERASW
ncbi:helix-turn-helix domain-containing protein [Streptomyces lavenduligriseus]|uniref:Helix-turn-helix domain-containing protein n=1 Tax=Streptomyces lavenduligriseus TaxID=67315 RepID=A0ABT0P854_9ACTN|nr:helix-turn-helix domain-containing protein [Streptomyces lavenduligriseus]MCL3999058.1 helix-turn-helix domain-containing protein [Streptomyces lavenduligriseus]